MPTLILTLKYSHLDFAMLRLHHSRGYKRVLFNKNTSCCQLKSIETFCLKLIPLLWDCNINQSHILKYHMLMNTSIYIYLARTPFSSVKRNLNFQLSTQISTWISSKHFKKRLSHAEIMISSTLQNALPIFNHLSE